MTVRCMPHFVGLLGSRRTQTKFVVVHLRKTYHYVAQHGVHFDDYFVFFLAYFSFYLIS